VDRYLSGLRRHRPPAVLLVLALLPALLAACEFDSRIAVRSTTVSGAPRLLQVTESFTEHQDSGRVRGHTTRTGQIVSIDCQVTIFYDVKEATGAAVLSQTYPVHLHTRKLPSGTPYEFDCNDPLVVELPAAASDVRAAATAVRGGRRTALPVQSHAALAGGATLRADPGAQLAVVGWPAALPPGDFHVELAFMLPKTPSFREKALSAASVACGRSRYLQPVLPIVTRMSQVPSLTIAPSARPTSVTVTRISQASTSVTLSC